MVALQFDHGILDCATRATCRLQPFAQRSHCRLVEVKAADHGYRLAGPAGCLATDANDAVALTRGLGKRGTFACRERLSAGRAHPPAVGRIDKTAVTCCLAHEAILDGSEPRARARLSNHARHAPFIASHPSPRSPTVH